MNETRPWGRFEVLYDGPDCKVKRIIVSPSHRLSYQYHFERNEDWLFISGHGIVTLDGIKSRIRSGQRIHIPSEMPHRIQNDGDSDLIFIEVQTGTSFDENDIVRIEDDYDRHLKNNL